ncbi:hypothetical protein EYF80_022240 [Liparis tanakae]|uniref:Uncharacterized protein n=1 Tax=Liparis tanakae TaxID=230148 RepID=A0A4Z2HP65_9TELE|nr:hypothetical protein EYF80_022240 [Liparis tanakae]
MDKIKRRKGQRTFCDGIDAQVDERQVLVTVLLPLDLQAARQQVNVTTRPNEYKLERNEYKLERDPYDLVPEDSPQRLVQGRLLLRLAVNTRDEPMFTLRPVLIRVYRAASQVTASDSDCVGPFTFGTL